MTTSVRPTYQAIIDQALRASGASTGWLLAVVGGGLQVVATAGLAAERALLDQVITPTGAQGYVLSSGQPAALMPQPHDSANDGAAGYPGVPTSVLAVPCGEEATVGVLELAAKHDANPFTFDDIAAVASLAVVAGAALAEDAGPPPEIVSPAILANELARLATQNPQRYADTARLIEVLLGRGA
jgi:GAF domain-containing protein